MEAIRDLSPEEILWRLRGRDDRCHLIGKSGHIHTFRKNARFLVKTEPHLLTRERINNDIAISSNISNDFLHPYGTPNSK